MGEPLLTAEELGRLERLRIRRRRGSRGAGRGEWRSPRHGAGGLFADHRPYVHGDDLRYVDWNVYGRLGDLVVKRFEAEESENVLLCVDRSRSMEGDKERAARRMAGALGYLALAHLDHVRLAWLPGLTSAAPSAHRGKARAAALLEELAEVPLAGDTDHVRDLAPVLGRSRHLGLALLFSDFFDPRGAFGGLALLRAHGLEIGAIHVVDPRDAELPADTSLVAVDRETGEERRVDVDADLQERIRGAWQRRTAGLERWCVAREIPYLRLDARRSLWTALHDLLGARVTVET